MMAQITQQANSQGQTIIAASGDAGAAACDYSSPISPVTSATHGLAVNAPASVPYVTGMGGSEFNEGAGNYWTASTGTDVIPSALSYIPEIVWNDTTSPENTTGGLAAGGGGASIYFSKPAWQTGPGVPNDNARDVPDLSLNASPFHDGYLVCVEGNCVNGYRNTSQALTVAGGTSAAAPTFAGMVALINQQMNTPAGQGNINPILYSMAQTSPAAFHDITTGNNMVPCAAATRGCPNGGEIGYSAGVGYDQASGLGSVDAYNLVMEWGSAGTGNLPAPTLTAPANGMTSVPVMPTFTWSPVTGSAGYRIMIATSPAALTTNPAVSTCTASACVKTDTTNATSYPLAIPLNSSALYYWQVQALEPASSTGTAAWSEPFVFNTGKPDFSLSVSPSALTISAGNSGTSTLTVAPLNNLNVENVTLTCAVPSTLTGVTCTAGTVEGNGTATITITAASTAGTFPVLPGNRLLFVGFPGIRGRKWFVALGVACLLLMGIWSLGWHGAGLCGRNGRPERRAARAARWPYVLVAGALACFLAAGLSCGGGSSTTYSPPTVLAPTAITNSAASITSATATLSGLANPNGTDTHAWFEYGINSSLIGAQATLQQDIGSGNSAVAVSTNIAGLSSGTTYYYQVLASNSAGTIYGNIVSFTTPESGTVTITGTSTTATHSTQISVSVN
jgi:subtilase family serine protease